LFVYTLYVLVALLNLFLFLFSVYTDEFSISMRDALTDKLIHR
jgi:hypothetical protein